MFSQNLWDLQASRRVHVGLDSPSCDANLCVWLVYTLRVKEERKVTHEITLWLHYFSRKKSNNDKVITKEKSMTFHACVKTVWNVRWCPKSEESRRWWECFIFERRLHKRGCSDEKSKERLWSHDVSLIQWRFWRFSSLWRTIRGETKRGIHKNHVKSRRMRCNNNKNRKP